MTAGFVLGGMSSGWADGKPAVGRAWPGALCESAIVLDEMDKASGADKRYDPWGRCINCSKKRRRPGLSMKA